LIEELAILAYELAKKREDLEDLLELHLKIVDLDGNFLLQVQLQAHQ
jgi:hypothetical protein